MLTDYGRLSIQSHWLLLMLGRNDTEVNTKYSIARHY